MQTIQLKDEPVFDDQDATTAPWSDFEETKKEFASSNDVLMLEFDYDTGELPCTYLGPISKLLTDEWDGCIDDPEVARQVLNEIRNFEIGEPVTITMKRVTAEEWAKIEAHGDELA